MITQYDYKNKNTFYTLIQKIVKEQKARGEEIILLPEHIGTWLIVHNSPNIIYHVLSQKIAFIILIICNLVAFIQEFFNVPKEVEDAFTYTILSTKNKTMLQIYKEVLSAIAREENIYIIGGSILEKVDKKIYNSCYIFNNLGEEVLVVRKMYPTKLEQTFSNLHNKDQKLTFKKNGKNIGVLICADSWYSECYKKLEIEDYDVLYIPAAVEIKDWEKVWNGYSGFTTPEEVDKKDIGVITERVAWGKYSFPTKSKKDVVVEFLEAKLWDKKFSAK